MCRERCLYGLLCRLKGVFTQMRLFIRVGFLVRVVLNVVLLVREVLVKWVIGGWICCLWVDEEVLG